MNWSYWKKWTKFNDIVKPEKFDELIGFQIKDITETESKIIQCIVWKSSESPEPHPRCSIVNLNILTSQKIKMIENESNSMIFSKWLKFWRAHGLKMVLLSTHSLHKDYCWMSWICPSLASTFQNKYQYNLK